MTVRTDFKELYVAQAGTQTWGTNQTLNDKDKSLDVSERIALTGLKPGHYDVKLVTENGKSCIVKNVDLTKEKTFVIKEEQISDCHQ